jgi:hypothetical protein
VEDCRSVVRRLFEQTVRDWQALGRVSDLREELGQEVFSSTVTFGDGSSIRYALERDGGQEETTVLKGGRDSLAQIFVNELWDSTAKSQEASAG